MLGLSFSEIIVVIIIAVIVVKPEDVPIIIKYLRQSKNFITSLKKEFYRLINDLDLNSIDNSVSKTADDADSFAQQVKELNYYLEKIHDSGITYDGDYEIAAVKNFYFKKVKGGSKKPRKKTIAKNSKT